MHSALPDPEYHADFYADVPVKRLIGFVIDTLVIVVLTILVLPFTAFTGIFFFPFLMMIVGFAYRVLSISAWSSTPGMRLMAIELRAMNAQRLDLPQAFMHTLLFTVFFSFIIPQLISMVLCLTGPRAQGLHDIALGTAAINRAARA